MFQKSKRRKAKKKGIDPAQTVFNSIDFGALESQDSHKLLENSSSGIKRNKVFFGLG
jgi:hypothetical protein